MLWRALNRRRPQPPESDEGALSRPRTNELGEPTPADAYDAALCACEGAEVRSGAQCPRRQREG
jgi:uncharacterized OsmC-like protein